MTIIIMNGTMIPKTIIITTKKVTSTRRKNQEGMNWHWRRSLRFLTPTTAPNQPNNIHTSMAKPNASSHGPGKMPLIQVVAPSAMQNKAIEPRIGQFEGWGIK